MKRTTSETGKPAGSAAVGKSADGRKPAVVGKPAGRYVIRPSARVELVEIDNSAEAVAARRAMFVGFGWTR